MCKVNIYEAKTNLSKYLEMLENGTENEIIICKYDRKIAVITPYIEKKEIKRLGAGNGILEKMPDSIKEGFDDIPGLFGY